MNPGWYPQIEVLVVEDDPFVRESFQIYLQTEGFHVSTARDGVEGLQKVREKEPDVVIADFRMPRMDGIGLLRAIKEHAPEVEVIIASGSATLESALDAMRLGAYSYIEKPVIDLDRDLKLVVTQAAERRQLRSTNLRLQGDLQRTLHFLEEEKKKKPAGSPESQARTWLRTGAKTPLQRWRNSLFEELQCEELLLYLRKDQRLYPTYSRNSVIDSELESVACAGFTDPGETCREVEREGLFDHSNRILLFPLFLFGRLEGLLAVPDRPEDPHRESWKTQVREFGDIAVAHICAWAGTASTTNG